MILRPRAGHLGHLGRRFLASLSSAPPAARDEAWARTQLTAAETQVWSAMSPADRRHAIAVARDATGRLGGDVSRPVVAAVLLHDCGKVSSGLGTFARVGATLWIGLIGRGRAQRGDGAVGRYARHEAIGADLLERTGSEPVTVALVGRRPSAPAAALAALEAADDAI